MNSKVTKYLYFKKIKIKIKNHIENKDYYYSWRIKESITCLVVRFEPMWTYNNVPPIHSIYTQLSLKKRFNNK